jgi:hypothetical protein
MEEFFREELGWQRSGPAQSPADPVALVRQELASLTTLVKALTDEYAALRRHVEAAFPDDEARAEVLDQLALGFTERLRDLLGGGGVFSPKA